MKFGVSSYCLDSLMEKGQMTLFEVIDWIARQGGESVEFVPFAFRFSDETTGTITGSIVVGGASDASYFAEQGAKIVCQCGIRGAFTHSRQEYAVIESIYDGIRLFTWTALNWQRFQQDGN